MSSFTRRRVAIAAGTVGLAAAVSFGAAAAANADGPTPSPSASSSAAAPTRPAHAPHIGGTVLTVDGSTVTVQDRDGFTRTIRLGSSVTVTKDGAKSDTSAITKGAHIEAEGTVDADKTTLDATTVRIGQPTGPDGRWGGRHGGHHGGPQGAPGENAPSTPNGTPSPAPSASGSGT
jgi:hypothetical protein